MLNKKLLSIFLMLMMVVTSYTVCYAYDSENSVDEEIIIEDECISQNDSGNVALTEEDILEIIEDVSGDDVNEDVQCKDESFVVETVDGEIQIPEDGAENVQFETNGYSIEMSLPEQFESIDGKLDEGTVVYNEEDTSAACAVQTIETEIQDAYVIRTLVTIGDASASHEYSFDFNLPEGCEIIRGEDYANSKERVTGTLYVVNNNSLITDEETGEVYPESILAIEPAWAKDANGNDVNTHYEINGSSVKQVVEFDENSAFPIVADPQYGGYYYTKANVTYSEGWGTGKQCSDSLTCKKGETGTVKCNKIVSVSGSVTGTIAGITTIGVGSTYNSTKEYAISFTGPATKYMKVRARQKIEKGTRQKRTLSTGKVVSTNTYTVRKNLYRDMYLYKVS